MPNDITYLEQAGAEVYDCLELVRVPDPVVALVADDEVEHLL